MNKQTLKSVPENDKSTKKALLEALVKKNAADATIRCIGIDICLTATDKI